MGPRSEPELLSPAVLPGGLQPPFSNLKVPSAPTHVGLIQSSGRPQGSCPALVQPISGSVFSQYLKAGSYSCTVLLQDIMLATFPAQLAERRELHQAEMAELSK